jgi:hypothetical protein
MNTSSLSFKSVNTRGFATVANTRFMQLVDGMDNSTIKFVRKLNGVSEIDVQSVELLPGIFCLYGANAFGILFMTSKSPSEGITAYAKFGQTSQKLLVIMIMLITELVWQKLVQT